MNSTPVEPTAGEIVQVNWIDRWSVYKRLQELEIPCCCGAQQPLRANINNCRDAFQLISVIKQLTASRQELIHNLERCWQQPTATQGD
ncbi:MAG: Asr1405/Asl0597 family protein [Microcoleaceae cyanobacterium]